MDSHPYSPVPPVRSDPGFKVRVGTCGWSFEDWGGVFFPAQMPAAHRLEFYSRFFNAVEIDSTFYAPPSPFTVAHWLDVTAPEFLFSAKMPREITHEGRLRGCEPALDAFLDALAPMHSKLACVLIQLPPHFTLKNDEAALRSFVARLPAHFRFAVEFRDPSWHLPRIAHLFESRNLCWVWNDLTALDHAREGAFEFLPRTTDLLYVRLLGDISTKYAKDGTRLHPYRSLLWPREDSLDSWAERVAQQLPHVSRALIFANNHFEGFSPLTAQRLGQRLGIALPLPAPSELGGRDLSDPDQLGLL